MLNITYIANARIPTQKAHGVQIMHTCEALARAGAHVELIVPHRRTDIKVDPYEYYSVEPVFSIRKIFVPDLIWAGPLGYLLHEWLFIFRIKNYLQRCDSSQIVYVRGEKLFLPLSSFADKHRIFFESHIKPRNLEQQLVGYLKASGVVVVTKHYEQELLAAGFEKNRVLRAPDGVDLRLFEKMDEKNISRQEFNLPVDQPIIGFVGKLTAMEQEKGVNDLLVAFKKIRREMPCFLLIVGATEVERRTVANRLISLGIPADAFEIVGHVPHAVALTYMHMADVLVMTYPDDAHYTHYLSPLKLFEYMASEVPIVATDIPSVRDIIGDSNARLVPPSNPEAMAETIVDLLTNKERAHALAKQARADVIQYAWEARALALLAFIKKNL